MCTACAEKRLVPQKNDQQLVSLDSSWSHRVINSDTSTVHKPRQLEERNSKHQEQALKLEHLESHDKVRQQRRSQDKQQNTQMQPEKREKLQEQQPRRRESQRNTREQSRSGGRRRRSTQTSATQQESARRSSVLQPFANHRVSRESMMRKRPASTVEIRTRTSVTKQRASVETPTRPRKLSSGQSEPRGSEKKGQRLSSTADILGMSRSLELPPNYFDMSSSSPMDTFSGTSTPEQDPLEWRQMETQLPQVELRKKSETEEEQQRRRSASYAHMLLRMRRHYDAVQVDGSHAHPATAPPRRVRAERRAQSVAVRSVKVDQDSPTNLAIDLDYLRAYKDAR